MFFPLVVSQVRDYCIYGSKEVTPNTVGFLTIKLTQKAVLLLEIGVRFLLFKWRPHWYL